MKITEALAIAEDIMRNDFEPVNFYNVGLIGDVIWTLQGSKKTNVQTIAEDVRTKANDFYRSLNPEATAKYGPTFLTREEVAARLEKYGN